MAVLAVLAFHAVPGKVAGGFVGVDIFFVISGFLITGIILREIQAGSFSLLGFYARRVRRIFPSLVLVLLAVLLLGWLILLPDEYAQLGQHIMAGALFSSNFLLWKEVGYFDPRAEFKPLLHLWSLGIEEQFYLLWPLTLLAVARLRWSVSRVIAAIAIASFALNLYLLASHPTAAFYSPFTRMWELLIGAMLTATLTHGRTGAEPRSAAIANAASVAGLALIAASIALFSAETAFPGWHALAPTVGAALVIAAGPRALLNRYLLSNRLAVYIGLISYPLYLWHWPLLSYSNILVLDDLNNLRVLKIAAVGCTGVAAALTYRFLEAPLRTMPLKTVVRVFSAAMAAAAVAGGIVVMASGVRGRFQPGALAIISNLDGERYAAPAAYRRGICFLTAEQTVTDLAAECGAGDPAASIVLWGDSYAAHLYPGLRQVASASDAPLSQYTMGACPPVLGYESPAAPHCAGFNNEIVSALDRQKPRHVIVAADWLSYVTNVRDFLPRLRTTLLRLKAGQQPVLLIGPPVSFYGLQGKIGLRAPGDDTAPNASLPALRRVDDALRGLAGDAGFPYVSPVSALCREGRCAVFVRVGDERKLLAWDWAHLTSDGSSLYAKTLIAPRLASTPR